VFLGHLGVDRLDDHDLTTIHAELVAVGYEVDLATFRERLNTLRKGYEPYAFALSRELLMDLPPWLPPDDGRKDNWETTAWEGSAPGESLR